MMIWAPLQSRSPASPRSTGSVLDTPRSLSTTTADFRSTTATAPSRPTTVSISPPRPVRSSCRCSPTSTPQMLRRPWWATDPSRRPWVHVRGTASTGSASAATPVRARSIPPKCSSSTGLTVAQATSTSCSTTARSHHRHPAAPLRSASRTRTIARRAFDSLAVASHPTHSSMGVLQRSFQTAGPQPDRPMRRRMVAMSTRS